MTTDEYIEFSKNVYPVHSGRYAEIIKDTFNHFMTMKCFVENNVKVNLKILSSSALFSEVVNTEPEISLIWDNFQWELVEKFYLSGLLALNKRNDMAETVFKSAIYSALSIQLTTIAPELSYVFAKYYRMYKEKIDADYIYFVSDAFQDLLYCQMISMGHEFAHIIFEFFDFGDIYYQEIEADFINLMHALRTAYPEERYIEGGLTYKQMVDEILSLQNDHYRKELICDIQSFDWLEGLFEKMDRKLNPDRTVEELYDDLLEFHNFVIRSLDSFLFIIEFWSQFGIRSRINKEVKPGDFSRPLYKLKTWGKQFEIRETLVKVYMKLHLMRDREIDVLSENKKTVMAYNEIMKMIQKLSSFEDQEWAQIATETNVLLHEEHEREELIFQRDLLLGIKLE